MPEPSSRRNHQCPPSAATHPRDRWETLFVYAFIIKFTGLKGKTDGLEGPPDLEDALLSKEPNHVLTQILTRFILNLRPQTRNIKSDQIVSTLTAVIADYCKTNERTLFWNEDLRRNDDPFANTEIGFWSSEWDFKLKILRQLVELQLCHAPEVKSKTDRAWGVQHMKHKKDHISSPPPDPEDPHSKQNLQMVPLGIDISRKRYWTIDSSPRIYVSTNPWKMSATFECIASTRDEYLAAIALLKAETPAKKGDKKARYQAHMDLIKSLEERLDLIDLDIARIQRVRRKAEQRNMWMAQAEVRQTRTRRQTKKPDYVYSMDAEEDDEADGYNARDDEDFEDDEADEDGPRAHKRRKVAQSNGTRRSARSSANKTPDARQSGNDDDWADWRGERRSARLGAPPQIQLDKHTEDTSSVSSTAELNGNGTESASGANPRASSPNRTAVVQVPGKKKSKFWYYAAEPVPSSAVSVADSDVVMNAPSTTASARTTPSREAESNEDESMDEGP